jgi:hypothetical protein
MCRLSIASRVSHGRMCHALMSDQDGSWCTSVMFCLLVMVAMPVWAGEKQGVMTEKERTARIQEFHRERARVEGELGQLLSKPEGRRSTVPGRTSDQPTKNIKASLESVPGVSARQGSAVATYSCPFVDRSEAQHDRTDIQYQGWAWMVGLPSAPFAAPMALAGPDQALQFGQTDDRSSGKGGGRSFVRIVMKVVSRLPGWRRTRYARSSMLELRSREDRSGLRSSEPATRRRT